MYNTSKFDPADETIPHDESLPLPRLPPIERERDKWPVVSWAVEPGDVIFFHFKTLHGGAPTRPGQRRRTLTLALFRRAHALRPQDRQGAAELPGHGDAAEARRHHARARLPAAASEARGAGRAA